MRGALYAYALQHDNVLTRLHPSTALIVAAAVSAIALTTLQPLILGALALFFLALIVLGRLPRSTLLVLVAVLPLCFFITMLQAVAQQRDIIARVPLGPITAEISGYGIRLGLLVTLRVLVLALTMTTFFTVVHPGRLTRAVHALGVPFKYAYTLTLALRFLPLMIEELATVRAAQKARGYDVDESNVVIRVAKIFPLIVPVMLTGLRRAETIALAMDLKAFNASPNRTYLVELYYGPLDTVVRIAAILFVVLTLAAQLGGVL